MRACKPPHRCSESPFYSLGRSARFIWPSWLQSIKSASSASAKAPSLNRATRIIIVSIMCFFRFILRERSTNTRSRRLSLPLPVALICQRPCKRSTSKPLASRDRSRRQRCRWVVSWRLSRAQVNEPTLDSLKHRNRLIHHAILVNLVSDHICRIACSVALDTTMCLIRSLLTNPTAFLKGRTWAAIGIQIVHDRVCKHVEQFSFELTAVDDGSGRNKLFADGKPDAACSRITVWESSSGCRCRLVPCSDGLLNFLQTRRSQYNGLVPWSLLRLDGILKHIRVLVTDNRIETS